MTVASNIIVNFTIEMRYRMSFYLFPVRPLKWRLIDSAICFFPVCRGSKPRRPGLPGEAYCHHHQQHTGKQDLMGCKIICYLLILFIVGERSLSPVYLCYKVSALGFNNRMGVCHLGHVLCSCNNSLSCAENQPALLKLLSERCLSLITHVLPIAVDSSCLCCIIRVPSQFTRLKVHKHTLATCNSHKIDRITQFLLKRIEAIMQILKQIRNT